MPVATPAFAICGSHKLLESEKDPLFLCGFEAGLAAVMIVVMLFMGGDGGRGAC